jgi:addiction module HigA family antidote
MTDGDFAFTGVRQVQARLKSLTTTRRKARAGQLPSVTPGELLLEEFMAPAGLTRYRLSKLIGVPPQRIGDIITGKRAITADTDLRLCKFFGLSNGYWLRAQMAHDLEITRKRMRKTLQGIKPWQG